VIRMKQYFLNPPAQPDESLLDSFYAELLLDKILRDLQKKQLLEEIDLSLKNRDKNEFLRLTEELRKYEE
jgi:uncharacterized protein YpiB (UPF0302 family)